ncbi:MAG: type II toxin-antitoxin system Phd/YefM family antitoxin [Cyanobacteriota bacterium]|jgi:antitoxin (DNA-binding transcriptional repressor) of toxin-antitoxin stability system
MDTIKALDLNEIPDKLPEILKLIQEGNSLILTQADQPIAEIKPITTKTKKRRPIGLCQGEFIVPDNFNDPLPEDIIKLFDNP